MVEKFQGWYEVRRGFFKKKAVGGSSGVFVGVYGVFCDVIRLCRKDMRNDLGSEHEGLSDSMHIFLFVFALSSTFNSTPVGVK